METAEEDVVCFHDDRVLEGIVGLYEGSCSACLLVLHRPTGVLNRGELDHGSDVSG